MSSLPKQNPEAGSNYNHRDFVRVAGGAAAVGLSGIVTPEMVMAEEKKPTTEQLVEKLYKSFSEEQRKAICFAWDHKDKERGLLRTHVSNNWSVTSRRDMNVGGSFFTGDQQDMIETIFFGLYDPEWHDRIRKQLRDDAGGYGKQQTIAIFGEPGNGKFEFVMTGRHLTIRCDGDSEEHVAFGGPIFYGHAAQGFEEKPDHPGNVFWSQAVKANKLYEMLDGKQRKSALIETSPFEWDVELQGKQPERAGLRVSDLSADQKEHMQSVLQTLIEPFRVSDQDEVHKCLKANGGLDECSISFFQDGDVGKDKVWDNWRLEGPTAVWYYRGKPHVHVWVNVADSSDIELNANG